MAFDMSSADPILKVHYGPQRLEEIAFKKRPLLAMIPKYTNFGGRNYPMPLKYGATHNRGVVFGTAQRSSGAGSFGTESQKLVEFLLTRTRNYGIGFLDGETLLATEGDKNAFVRAMTSEMDSVLEGLMDDIHQGLYTTNTGLRATATAGTTTTFTVPVEEAVRFEVGMLVVHAATATGALLNSAEVRRVTAVNRQTGVVTVNTAASTSYAPGSGEFIWAAGDRIDGAITGDGLKVSGLDDWLPSTAPSSTSFFGVDRSVDTLKLGGVRVDGSSLTMSEALTEGVVETSRYGGKIDHYFMNHTDVKNLINELGSKAEYDMVKAPKGNIGFDAFKIITPMGMVDVIGDHACPPGVAFGLTMNTWKLVSVGPVPRLLNFDGSRILRQVNSDSYEFRFGAYYQLGCNAPGHNCRVTLPSAA